MYITEIYYNMFKIDSKIDNKLHHQTTIQHRNIKIYLKDVFLYMILASSFKKDRH